MSESLTRTGLLVRTAYSRRDVEILMLVLNHPALLEHHAEDLAHIDFGHADLEKLRDLLVDLSDERSNDHISLKSAIDSRGFASLRARIEVFAEKIAALVPEPACCGIGCGTRARTGLGLAPQGAGIT